MLTNKYVPKLKLVCWNHIFEVSKNKIKSPLTLFKITLKNRALNSNLTCLHIQFQNYQSTIVLNYLNLVSFSPNFFLLIPKLVHIEVLDLGISKTVGFHFTIFGRTKWSIYLLCKM